MNLKYFENLTQDEAEKKAKELKGRILTNNEIDNLLMQKILNPSITPLWAGTKLTYNEKGIGTIKENNKSYKLKIPKEDGWYEVDKFGLPTGNSSTRENNKARYLWRREKFSGLVLRCYYGFGDGRRDVDVDYEPVCRFGVLIEVKKL